MAEKKKPNRNRTKTITIRLTQEEYDAVHEHIKNSEYPNHREFILMATNCTVFTDADKEELQKINETLADYDKQLRGVATNLNQIARKANAENKLPTINHLNLIYSEVQKLRREVTPIWESIRQQIKLANTRKHSKTS